MVYRALRFCIAARAPLCLVVVSHRPYPLHDRPISVFHRLSIESEYLSILHVTLVKWARDGEMSAEELGVCLRAGGQSMMRARSIRQARCTLRMIL
jgi:hypothetical protein